MVGGRQRVVVIGEARDGVGSFFLPGMIGELVLVGLGSKRTRRAQQAKRECAVDMVVGEPLMVGGNSEGGGIRRMGRRGTEGVEGVVFLSGDRSVAEQLGRRGVDVMVVYLAVGLVVEGV